MSNHELQHVEGDLLPKLEEEEFAVLARHQDTCGVFWIIPQIIGIAWCINGTKIKVCLRLLILDVVCSTIDAQHPCVPLEGNVECAKASIEVCFKNNCLTYKAQACYRDFPCLGAWKCAEASGNIICF